VSGCAADEKTYKEALANVQIIIQKWIVTRRHSPLVTRHFLKPAPSPPRPAVLYDDLRFGFSGSNDHINGFSKIYRWIFPRSSPVRTICS
jgi:hypothetical protein